MIDIDLSGRTALVTGAGAGIGRAIASCLAAAGASVAVNDIDPRRATGTVDALRAAGHEATAAVADVRIADQVDTMVGSVVDRFGRLDIAVNNVGMMGGLVARPFLEMSIDDARTVIERNLLATYLCCRVEATTLAATGGGLILNVTSGEASRPSPLIAAYGAAKAAISHLTGTLAVELGPYGIRVNAMAPGSTYTEEVAAVIAPDSFAAIGASTPLRRSSELDDLGHLAVFLASPGAVAITGQVINADNGAGLARAPIGARPTQPGNP